MSARRTTSSASARRNGPATTLALMEAAARAGIAVQSLSVQSTTLDDVFVHYAGARPARRAAGGVGPGQPVHAEEGLTMGRTWAIVEREMRRFRRSPILIAMSMVMPVVQLVVLGYAFGGNVKHLKLGDRGPGPRRAGGAHPRAGVGRGLRRADDRHRGLRRPGPGPDRPAQRPRRTACSTIPPDFSRRVLAQNEPRIALIEDNTDNFVSVALAGDARAACSASYSPSVKLEPRVAARAARSTWSRSIPTCPTCSTCCRARS